MNAYGKTLTALFSVALAASALCADRPATWIDELEESSDYIEPDCIDDDDDEFEPPFPKDVEEKYNLTKDEVLFGLKTIAMKYDAGETDKKRITARLRHISSNGQRRKLNLPFSSTDALATSTLGTATANCDGTTSRGRGRGKRI